VRNAILPVSADADSAFVENLVVEEQPAVARLLSAAGESAGNRRGRVRFAQRARRVHGLNTERGLRRAGCLGCRQE